LGNKKKGGPPWEIGGAAEKHTEILFGKPKGVKKRVTTTGGRATKLRRSKELRSRQGEKKRGHLRGGGARKKKEYKRTVSRED